MYVESAFLQTPDGTSYQVNWSNPDCSGYPPWTLGYHPNISYNVSHDININYPQVVSGITQGRPYWPYLASNSLNYNGLSNDHGIEIAIIASDLGPGIPADFNHSTRVLRVNPFRFGHLNDENWGMVAAHEFGHAFGFWHAGTSEYSKSVMPAIYDESTGLLPRDLDKCAVVQAYPVDRRQG